MQNNNLFTKFDYLVWSSLSGVDKVEVRVYFIYRERYIIRKPLFIKMVKNKDEAYYLMEAKKIIANKIRDGSLKKECEKEVKRKRLLPILIPVVSAMAIAGIAVGTYFGLKQPSPTPPPPALSELLTIEYEYQNTTDNDTVGFLIANQDGSEVTFDWGDGNIETIPAYTDPIVMLDNPVTHTYTSAPRTGNTYTITVSGDLALFFASAKDWEGSNVTMVIEKGNFYFKSAILHKNLSEMDIGGTLSSQCSLGGVYDDSTSDEYSKISQISFDDAVTVIPATLMQLSSLEHLTIPKQVTFIDNHAFTETYLKEVMFEENSSLETIGKYSFSMNDELRTVTIPRTVKAIKTGAFEGCENLWNINLHEFNQGDELPTIETDSFINDYSLYFVTKSDEVAQKFKTVWGSTLSNANFFRGASMVFEDTTDGEDGYGFDVLTYGDLLMNDETNPKFFFETIDQDEPELSTFQVTNNLNKTMAVKHGASYGFEISNDYYEEGLIWIKVTYQP